jgi:hypothetical protein
LLLVWLVPGPVREAAKALQTRPWGSLGWGILVVVFVCIAVPVVAFLVIVLDLIFGGLGFGSVVVSITGLGFLTNATIIVSFLITVAYITKAVVSFLVGRMILERIREPWGAGRVWPLVLGIVLFAIVRAIPFLGWPDRHPLWTGRPLADELGGFTSSPGSSRLALLGESESPPLFPREAEGATFLPLPSSRDIISGRYV